ncbi:MAG: hypothetical protein ABF356_11630 [Polycyclovorans sp.]
MHIGALLLGVLAVAAFAAPPRPADALLGRWQSAEAPEAIVQIALREEGFYEGKVVAHDSDPARVGKLVFRDLRYDAETQRWRGRAFAPKLGRELDAEIALTKPDQFTLSVSTFFGRRKVDWQRVP